MTKFPIRKLALTVTAALGLLATTASAALQTNELIALFSTTSGSGIRDNTQTSSDPLKNLNAGAVRLGEVGDDGFTNTENNYLIIFDLASVPPANYSNCSFQIRYAFANSSYMWPDLTNPPINLDLYGLGFSDGATNFPATAVFKNSDVPSGTDGIRVIDNFYTNGTPSANIDTNALGTAVDRRAYNVTALCDFMQTRPIGPTGRYAFFRVNHDAPFPLNAVVDSTSVNFNLRNGTTPRLGISYVPTITYVTNFTATSDSISVGDSTTLSWVVDSGVTNLVITDSLTTNVIDALATSAGGVGNTSVSPANDTTYTLAATKDGITLLSSEFVNVYRQLSNTFLDSWIGAATNTDALPEYQIFTFSTWTSSSGRVANASGAYPEVRTNSTPNGKDAIFFNRDEYMLQSPGGLTVDAATNPVVGLTEFTLAMVIRPDASTPPVSSGVNWFQGAGIVDANSVTITTDWGTSLTTNGTVMFGVANPEQNITSTTSLLDGDYHVVVVQWGAGASRIYVDRDAAVEATGVSTGARNNDPLVFGGVNNGLEGGLTNSYRGEIAEIRFYSEAADSSQISSLITELADEYGITLPPAGPGDYKITNVSGQPGSVTLTWETVSGLAYQVIKRATLTGPESSITNVTATGASTTITDFNATNGEGYYRISSP